MGKFIDELCDVRPNLFDNATNLYETFRIHNPETGMTPTAFGRRLGKDTRLSRNPQRTHIRWDGIRLK